MISRPATCMRLARTSNATKGLLSIIPARHFSSTPEKLAKNRIYTPVRRPEEFHTFLSNCTSTRTPLLTFWTASYCRTCQTVSPILKELIADGVGEEEGGVAFCEVEFDSMDIMDSDLGLTFAITSMPTLLAFHKGFANAGTKATDPAKMRDREWLKEWIRTEARRRDGGGPGGNVVGGPMAGFFGFR